MYDPNAPYPELPDAAVVPWGPGYERRLPFVDDDETRAADGALIVSPMVGNPYTDTPSIVTIEVALARRSTTRLPALYGVELTYADTENVIAALQAALDEARRLRPAETVDEWDAKLEAIHPAAEL